MDSVIHLFIHRELTKWSAKDIRYQGYYTEAYVVVFYLRFGQKLIAFSGQVGNKNYEATMFVSVLSGGD